VALSATGKAKGVLENLVLAVLAASPTGLQDSTAIAHAVEARLGVEIDDGDLQQALSSLLMKSQVQRHPTTRRLVLVPSAAAEQRQQTETAEKLQAAVRGRWLDVAATRPELASVAPAVLWNTLAGYLSRVFRQHGALAAQMIDPAVQVSDADTGLVPLLAEAATDAGVEPSDALTAAVSAFCKAPCPELQRYLSTLLNAVFTLYALSVPAATANYLRGQLHPLDAFLDTNILYDLLGLHPATAGGSTQLIQFIRDNEFPFKLWVHERTVKEFRATLDWVGDRLKSKRWTPALSRAALTLSEGLHAVDRRFHELNAESPVDPAMFVERYYDVPELLRESGVAVFRPTVDEDVNVKSGLINEYKAFLEENRPDGDKPYGTLDHDMVVWLAVHGLRRDGSTPLDAGAVLVTNDRWLHRFDWRQLRTDGVGEVVLPVQLLQALRPFGRPGRAFDEAFLADLVAPDLNVNGTDYSKTTEHVMSALASYGDLSTETAAAMLRNTLVRTQLEGLADDSPEAREVLDAAVASENARLSEERQQQEAELAALRQRYKREQAEVGAALASGQQQVAELKQRLDDTHARAEAERSAVRERERALQEHVEQKRLEREEAAAQERRAREQLAAEVRKLTLQSLERDERERAAAQEAQYRRERRRRLVRMLVAAVAAAIAVSAVVLPDLLSWDWVTHADHRRRLQAFVAMAAVGGGYAVAGPRRHRGPVMSLFVLGAIYPALALLGR
jgi:hypothetical protein